MGFFDTDNDPSMTAHNVGQFKFTAVNLGDLGATEYTLATVVVDCSPSIEDYVAAIEAALKETSKSCRRSPRADNLLLQIVCFNSRVWEVHGFRPLADIKEDDYTGCVKIGGMTALNDAVYFAAEAQAKLGKELAAKDYTVNGAIFVITDGIENQSTTTFDMVKKSLAKAKQTEVLESIMTVLIGVNTATPGVQTFLDTFQKEAGFQQFVDISKATEKELAKLGGFISKSISSQSQALGTGGGSQSLKF
jgi:hypothetical protein